MAASTSQLPSGWTGWFWATCGWSNRRHLAHCARVTDEIRRQISVLQAQTASLDIRDQYEELRYRALCQEPLPKLLPEVYALVSEATQSALGITPYNVQLVAATALAERCVAEMATGEGKTLTAVLPLALWAMYGRGVWLATANDYLARRDAEWLTPVYQQLGLSVGILQSESTPTERRAAYACDVTYGTVREFGFDFLRDRLSIRKYGMHRTDLTDVHQQRAPAALRERLLQRTPGYVLVDEADSVLIDEARTPLVLSTAERDAESHLEACFRWSAVLAETLVENQHFLYDGDWQDVLLTEEGRAVVRSTPCEFEVQTMRQPELYRAVERAVRVRRNFRRDRDYIVRDQEIVVIDENTGRPGEGRKWQDGVHQAIEARENVTVTWETRANAQVTVQELFHDCEHLAGMTGTATSAAAEFRLAYRLRVLPIPTHRPSRRVVSPARLCLTRAEKWDMVAHSAAVAVSAGRPVLVGTRSIGDSLAVSAKLTAVGIAHEVLNANELEREAAIVSVAGQRGSVVVATNMAGRGTDIRLGPGVPELGGLHVIATELHDSSRVDRQLIGRCGRQGDPGSVEWCLSLEDEVLATAWGKPAALRLRDRWTPAVKTAPASVLRLLHRAQRKIERRHARERRRIINALEAKRKAQSELGQDPYLDGAN